MSQNEIIEFIQFGYVLNVIALIFTTTGVIVDLVRNFALSANVSKEIQNISKEYRELSLKYNKVRYLISVFGLFIPFVYMYEYFSLYIGYAKLCNWNIILMSYSSICDKVLKLKLENKENK